MRDNGLDINMIFNGDFSRHDIFGGEIDRPGWMLHGGGGDGNINFDRLVLNQGDSSLTHNKLFIPANAEYIVFYLKVTNRDWFGSPPNQLVVKIGDLPLNFGGPEQIILDESARTDWHWRHVAIPGFLRGTVQTIGFSIETFGYDVDSAVKIDNVQYFLVPYYSTAGELQIVKGSPVDLLITDPIGDSIGRNINEIFAATYDAYETTPGDSGATVTIPYPDEGDYLIKVIPWSTALPDDTYSLFAVLEGDTTFFAENNPIENIPEEGYVISIIDTVSSGECYYIIGDVNASSSYNGLDVTYGVAFLKGGPDPLCDSCECPDHSTFWVCGDVNGSCSYNGLDITYGVSFLKGEQDSIIACADCPPAGGPAVLVIERESSPGFISKQVEKKTSDKKPATKDMRDQKPQIVKPESDQLEQKPKRYLEPPIAKDKKSKTIRETKKKDNK